MSYSLNSLKGDIQGSMVGAIAGDKGTYMALTRHSACGDKNHGHHLRKKTLSCKSHAFSKTWFPSALYAPEKPLNREQYTPVFSPRYYTPPISNTTIHFNISQWGVFYIEG